MIANLRPMNLGEILDRTFQIYRAKFLTFVAISALPALVSVALGLVVFIFQEYGPNTTLPASSKATWSFIFSWLPRDYILSLAYYFTWPAYVLLASRLLLSESLSISCVFLQYKARWQSCLALAGILAGLIHLLPSLLVEIIRTSGIGPASGGFGGIIGATAGIFSFLQIVKLISFGLEFLLLVMLGFSVPAWTMEDLRVNHALRRGWVFGKRNWARVFVAWLLTNTLHWILYTTISDASLIAIRLIFGGSSGEPFFRERFALLVPELWVASALTAPLLPIFLTLFYYDQRIRHEGYDIERMMDAAGLNAPAPPPSAEVPAASAEAVEEQV